MNVFIPIKDIQADVVAKMGAGPSKICPFFTYCGVVAEKTMHS